MTAILRRSSPARRRSRTRRSPASPTTTCGGKADSEVTLAEVLENAEQNQKAIKARRRGGRADAPGRLGCDAHTSLEGTVNTPTEAILEDTRERVEPLLGDYL